MSVYVVVGLLLVATAVFLLQRWKGNPKVERPPAGEEPNHRGDPTPKEYPVTIYKDGVPLIRFGNSRSNRAAILMQ